MKRLRWLVPLIVALASVALLMVAANASTSGSDYQFSEYMIYHYSGGHLDHDGHTVVWRHGGWVYLYDLDTDEYSRGVNEFNPEMSKAYCPRVSGDWVVWMNNDGGWEEYDYSIIVKNIKTGEARYLFDNERSVCCCADIDGDYVVWSDVDERLWLYSISADSSVLITDTGKNDNTARIDWPWVVWQQQLSDPVMWAYHVTTTQQFSLTHGGFPSHAMVSDGRALWTDNTPLYVRNIFGMNLETREPFTVTYDTLDRGYINFDSPFVVWTASVDGSDTIQMYDLDAKRTYTVTSTATDDRGAVVYDNMIVWRRDLHSYLGEAMWATRVYGHQSHQPMIASAP
jgi:hypothetical protein